MRKHRTVCSKEFESRSRKNVCCSKAYGVQLRGRKTKPASSREYRIGNNFYKGLAFVPTAIGRRLVAMLQRKVNTEGFLLQPIPGSKRYEPCSLLMTSNEVDEGMVSYIMSNGGSEWRLLR